VCYIKTLSVNRFIRKLEEKAATKNKPGIVGIDIGTGLISIVVVGFIILMFAVVAGRAWSTQENSISAITNTQVKVGVSDVAVNTFTAFKDLSSQLTLFGILFVLLVVVSIAYTFTRGGGMGGGYERVM